MAKEWRRTKRERRPFPKSLKEKIMGMDPERMAYQGLGGIAGGLVPPYDPITTPIKIGLGSSIAGQMVDRTREFRGIKEPDTLTQASLTAAQDAMFDVISPAAMRAGIYAAKGMGAWTIKKIFKSYGAETYPLYKKFGLQPTVGLVTKSKTAGMSEEALSKWPFSAGVFQDVATHNRMQLEFANEFLAKEYGNVLTVEQTGSLLKRLGKKKIEKLKGVYDRLFRFVERGVGDQPQTLVNLRELRVALASELEAGAPKTAILGKIDEILKQSANFDGKLPFKSIKEHRSVIGDLIKEPGLLSNTNLTQGNLKRMYSALTSDMEKAASRAGPRIEARFKAVDQYYKTAMEERIPLLENIVSKGYDEDVHKVLVQQRKKGGSRLRQLRREATQEEWNSIAGSELHRLGIGKAYQQTAEDQFSVRTFLTNWYNLSKESRQALWAGTKYHRLYKELNDLVKVSGDFAELDKLANKSNTGSVLQFYGILQATSGATGAVMAGLPGAAVAGMTTMYLGPVGLAKMLTNVKFVRWLAQGVKIMKTNPNAMKIHLGRLFALRAEEEIRPQVEKMIEGFGL